MSKHERLERAQIISGRFGGLVRKMTGNLTVTLEGPWIWALDPNGANRDVTLPVTTREVQYTFIHSGTTFVLNIKSGSTIIATLAAGEIATFFGSSGGWFVQRAGENLDIFTDTIAGLVPPPGPGHGGALFLRSDRTWAQTSATVNADAYKNMTDGTNTAVGTGPDTFKFRSSDNSILLTVGNNDATHGDNLNVRANPSVINHDTLLNYDSDEHFDHTLISVATAAGSGLKGGGTIAATRNLSLDLVGLTTVVPVLADNVPFYDVSGAIAGRHTFGTLNGILDHNDMLNYSANRHIDHTGVSIMAGAGLSGGGTIDASRSISLNIGGLTADTPVLSDEIMFYDVSGGDYNKTTLSALNAILDVSPPLHSITNAHLSIMTVNRIKGRIHPTNGDVADLTAAEVRAILVESDSSNSNLIYNGSFEDGLTNFAATGTVTVETDSAGCSGLQYLKIAEGSYIISNEFIPTTSGEALLASVMVKGTSAAAAHCRMTVYFYDETNTVVGTVATLNFPITTSWTKVSAPFVANVGTRVMRVRIQNLTGSAVATMSIDEWSVTRAVDIPAASETVAGISEIATAAEAKAATDTTRSITPSNFNMHPGSFKAWTVAANSGATQRTYNVSSVVDMAVGALGVNFTTPFANTIYPTLITISTTQPTQQPNCKVSYVFYGSVTSTASRKDVHCSNVDDTTMELVDPSVWTVAFAGDF